MIEWLKSIFGFKTKGRINKIIGKLKSHRIKESINYIYELVYNINQIYLNKRRILKIINSKKAFVSSRKVKPKLLELIKLQLDYLNTLEKKVSSLMETLTELIEGIKDENLKISLEKINKFLLSILDYKKLIEAQELQLNSLVEVFNLDDYPEFNEKDKLELMKNEHSILKEDFGVFELTIEDVIKFNSIYDEYSKKLNVLVEKIEGRYGYLNKQIFNLNIIYFKGNKKYQDEYTKAADELERLILEFSNVLNELIEKNRQLPYNFKKIYEEEFHKFLIERAEFNQKLLIIRNKEKVIKR